MKVTEVMYGRAAKCVACHQKWFVPKRDEIAPGTVVIHLKDHPELLRHAGVFVRSRSVPAEVLDLEGPEDISSDPVPVLETDEHGVVEDDEAISERRSSDKFSGGGAGNLCHDPHQSQSPEHDSPVEDHLSDREALAPIRSRGKKPFDILEPLRVLCCYQRSLENLEHRMLASEHSGVSVEILGAYQRSLEKARRKLSDSLKKRHEGVERQLTGLEKEIDRLYVALRIGETDLSNFFSLAASLRNSRECLARYDHHLLAWQNVQDPFLAGGLTETAIESFDEESFSMELPAPDEISDSDPLFVYYSNELRKAMHTRSGIELRLEEWKRLAVERPVSASSLETGMAESSAARERIEAAISFFRQRLQVLLTDCAHDLESLQKYRRDVLDRDRKGQIKGHSKDILLRDIENAESGLIRVQAHIRKALHANAETEVPVPSITLAERLSPRHASDLRVPAAYASVVATVLLLAGLLLLSYRETGGIYRMVLLPVFFVLLHPLTLLFQENRIRKAAALLVWVFLCVIISATLVLFSRYTPIHPGRLIAPYFDVLGLLLLLGSACSGITVGIVLIDQTRSRKSVKTIVPLVAAIVGALIVGVFYVQAQSGPAAVVLAPVGETTGEVPGPLPRSAMDTSGDSEALLPTQGFDPAGLQVLPEQETVAGVQSPEQSPATTVVEGEKDLSSEQPGDAHRVSLGLIGVVHGEGRSPRFRATAQFSDGRQETLSIQLGDLIAGDWKAVEYNSEDKKLTVANGKRMLLLGAGDTVVIDDYVSSEGEPDSE